MTRRNSLVALLLSLCLMLGAVSEAVARSEMAGMSDLVLCGAQGQTTITLDATGHPVQRHPCTHCLASAGLALLVTPTLTKPPARLFATLVRPATATWQLLASVLTPSARGPPSVSV